jgi:antitoxin component YwqK of YwqJK toxin-antitoxin module
MMKSIFTFSLLSFLLFACQKESGGSADSTAAVVPLSGQYIYEDVPASDAQIGFLKDATGKVLETGGVRNGKKNGSWTYYSGESEFPVKLITYVDDVYNGIYLEFNGRGQAELMATYRVNKLHGPWGKYRFGRPEITANYVDGELDGVLREYDYKNGKLKKEVSYKAGVLDGLVRDYDEEGNIMVEYMYRNGEKVSGGIVAPQGE